MRRTRRARRRLLVVGLMVMIGALAAGGSKLLRVTQKQRTIAAAREAGLTAYHAGDISTALRELSNFYSSEKDDLEATLAFADARAREPMPNAQHLYDAISLYDSALQLLESATDAGALDQRVAVLVRLLDLQETLGRLAELRSTADRLLKFDPDHVAALAAKLNSMLVLNDPAGMSDIADRLIALEPDILRWRQYRLEAMRRASQSRAEMLQLCRQWDEQPGSDGRYLGLQARIVAASGDADQARGLALAAAQRGAETEDVLDELVATLDRLGERVAATDLVQQTAQAMPDRQWVRRAVVRRHWEAHRLEEALAEIDRAEGDFGALDRTLERFRLVLLESKGDRNAAVERANALLTRAQADGDDVNQAWADAALAWLKPGGRAWEDRLNNVFIARTLDSDDAILPFVHGSMLAASGEYQLAVQAYRDAVSRNDNWIVPQIALIESCLSIGRAPEAFDRSLDMVSRWPQIGSSPYILLSRAYLAMLASGNAPRLEDGRDGRAVRIDAVLTELRAAAPGNPEVAAMLAEAHVRLGRPAEARQYLRVLISDETDPAVLLAVARTSRRFQLGLESELIASAESAGADPVEVALERAAALASTGEPARGLALIDGASAAGGQNEALAQRRLAYLSRWAMPEYTTSAARLLSIRRDSIAANSFVLTLAATWEHADLVEQALASLERLVGANSQQVRLLRARQILQFEAESEPRLAEAMVMISEILPQSPDSLDALMLMAQGSLLSSHPSIERAIEHLRRAATLYPGEASICIQLVSLLQRQGDFEGAETYLAQISRLAAQDPALRDVEFALLRIQGDVQSARQRAVARIDSNSTVPEQLLLAALHEQSGEAQAAEQTYTRLIAAKPADRAVVIQAAHYYAKTGRFDHGEAMIAASPDEVARLTMLGDLYEQHGRAEAAERFRLDAIEAAPRSLEARHRLARHYLRRGLMAQAREQAQLGLELDGDHAGLQQALRLASIQNGAGQGAIKALLSDLVTKNPDLAPVTDLLANIAIVDGKARPTQRQLDAAIKLTETHSYLIEAWGLAINLHADAGEVGTAIDLARSAVGRFPANPQPPVWATHLLTATRRWNEALYEAEEWSRRTQDNPLPADLKAASILLELGRARDAVTRLSPYEARLQREAEVNPGNLAVWIECLAHAGEVDRAVRTVRPLLDVDAKWRQGLLAMSRRLHPPYARELLSHLNGLIDDNSERMALIESWLELARRSDCEPCIVRAEALAHAALDHPGTRQPAQLALALAAETRGDRSVAEQRYRDVLAQSPHNPVALNNLAALLADQPGRAEEALRLIDQALAKAADQPDFLDTRATALRQLDRLDAAEADLTRALAARPGDAGVTLHLIAVLLDQGKNQAAERHVTSLRLTRGLNGLDDGQRDQLDAMEQRLRQVSASRMPSR